MKMTATRFNKCIAVKRLIAVGIKEKQATEIIHLFANISAVEAAKNKFDMQFKDIKLDMHEIKTDLIWLNTALFFGGGIVFLAALKYIFLG